MAVTRFWVGGTGTWDNADTTHWSASTGGAGGASVPVAGDSATFDAASGGGTVTVNHATINLAVLTCGAHTGTLDFSVNNNSLTITNSMLATGSGTRTLNLGNGTWTLSGTSTPWSLGTTTGLTFNANSSTILFTGLTGNRTFAGGAGLTYNIVTFSGGSTGASMITLNGTSTITTCTVNAPNLVSVSSTLAYTTLNLNGTSAFPMMVCSNVPGSTRTMTVTTLNAATYCGFRDITMTGSGTAYNSIDYGNNSGFTILPSPVAKLYSYQRGTPY